MCYLVFWWLCVVVTINGNIIVYYSTLRSNAEMYLWAMRNMTNHWQWMKLQQSKCKLRCINVMGNNSAIKPKKKNQHKLKQKLWSKSVKKKQVFLKERRKGKEKKKERERNKWMKRRKKTTTPNQGWNHITIGKKLNCQYQRNQIHLQGIGWSLWPAIAAQLF